MVRLVIDTDPGVDDAHAIMAAFAHPEAQIEALTTVAGNVSLERTTANVCIILDVLEQNVPVYAGCEGPLVGPVIDAGYFHGADGLGDSGYPPSPRQVADEHAVNALIRLANGGDGWHDSRHGQHDHGCRVQHICRPRGGGRRVRHVAGVGSGIVGNDYGA